MEEKEIKNETGGERDESQATTPQSKEKPSKARAFFREIVTFALLTLFIVVPIRVYIAQPYIVSGSSMDPTFSGGDYLIVDQISYRLDKISRGDVAIFRYPQNPSKFFIKRIIGLPGETLTIKEGIVSVESTRGEKTRFTLSEPYLLHKTFEELVVSLDEDEYFVMGDNRQASFDSRSWGPLNKEFLVGRALVRLFPITKAAYLPGSINYLEVEE